MEYRSAASTDWTVDDDAMETSDPEIADITPRVREHRERKGKLKAATAEARAAGRHIPQGP